MNLLLNDTSIKKDIAEIEQLRDNLRNSGIVNHSKMTEYDKYLKNLNKQLIINNKELTANEDKINTQNKAISNTTISIERLQKELGTSTTRIGKQISASIPSALSLATSAFGFLKDNILEIEKQTH